MIDPVIHRRARLRVVRPQFVRRAPVATLLYVFSLRSSASRV
jgi:hypothetical protein